MKSAYQFRSSLPRVFVLSLLLLFVLFPCRMTQGAELPDTWRWGQEVEIPTIEDLTEGKLKTGDLVTKENVDVVKELLPLSVYESVKRGMVIILAPFTPLELSRPAYFLEATEKNKGKAVIGENDVVYTKDGRKWIGGFPFPDPQRGIEAMGNFRFGTLSHGVDDYNTRPSVVFVDRNGKGYKWNYGFYRKIYIQPRLHVAPLGVIPGHEEENYRGIICFTEPYDMRGLSQLVIRYYDDTARPDEGYLYLPALKRTRRISASNWQDNMAGMDGIWGDCDGFSEPFSGWNFKLVGKKRFMIFSGHSNPFAEEKPDGSIDPKIKYDVGRKFARGPWEVRPVVVVEATPEKRHVYSKRIFHMDALSYVNGVFEMYDRQGQLWRQWWSSYGHFKGEDGQNYSPSCFNHWFDLQTDHMTNLTPLRIHMNEGASVGDYSLKKMLQMGR